MPLDALVTGRVATLAGERGFGWVEAVGIKDGRVAFAGSAIELETRADPFTVRFELDPDEVAIPGLTDAHLHLAEGGIATENVDLSQVASLADGLAVIAAAHGRLEPDAWLEGHGWESDRWGGWPTAADLDRAAPGRRVALWAHDHHALWVSGAALTETGIDRTTDDPPGGLVRRDAAGEPTGILHEAAARLVMNRVPRPSDERYERLIEALARDLVRLGVVAVHDPGALSLQDGLGAAIGAYRRLAERGRLPLRVHACIREEQIAAAAEAGLRSGDPLGPGTDRARFGWLKLFADGTLASRTAALLEPIEPEPDRPLPAGTERGVFITPPARLAELAAGAADAAAARRLWGARAEANGYAWRSIAETGAVLAFGTDAPVEPIDPWPGLAMAVTRMDASWPAGTPPFGPGEALTLERAIRAASIGPAVTARERDRGRLIPGQRADLVVLPIAALTEPVEPGGALATARPRLVLVDGAVAYEA